MTDYQLSAIHDAARQMGEDTDQMDLMADALLFELSVVSVLRPSLEPQSLTSIRSGVRQAVACVTDIMNEGCSAASAGTGRSAYNLDGAMRTVWEGTTGAITDTFEKLAMAANTGASC